MTAEHQLPSVQAATEAFQRYVIERSSAAAPHWASSRPLIQAVAASAVGQLGEVRPPIRLDTVAQLLKIEIRCAQALSSKHYGKLAPTAGGFVATVYGQLLVGAPQQGEFPLSLTSADQPTWLHLNRQGRFTLAHEFGHTLFYTLSRKQDHPARVIPRRSLSRNDIWREEGLCDAFARALLVPDRWKTAVGKLFSFSNLIESAKYFGVPGEVILHRAIHDWAMWSSRTVLRVDFRRENPSVRVFRGGARHKNSPALTGRRVAALLTECDSALAAAEILKSKLRISDRKLLIHGKVLWVDY
jgi:hypothetical protein